MKSVGKLSLNCPENKSVNSPVQAANIIHPVPQVIRLALRLQMYWIVCDTLRPPRRRESFPTLIILPQVKRTLTQPRLPGGRNAKALKLYNFPNNLPGPIDRCKSNCHIVRTSFHRKNKGAERKFLPALLYHSVPAGRSKKRSPRLSPSSNRTFRHHQPARTLENTILAGRIA
jgi:hypothetical protein